MVLTMANITSSRYYLMLTVIAAPAHVDFDQMASHRAAAGAGAPSLPRGGRRRCC